MVDKFITRKRNQYFSASSSSSSVAVGLGILVPSSHGYEDDSNTILVSAALRLRLRLSRQPQSHADVIAPPTQISCYLKSCFLCRKRLSPDMDVYMYRGDQGFCSVECRKYQIIVDDKKELEVSTKIMVAAYRRCSGMTETGVLIDDLRRRNKQIPPHKVRAIFS